MARIDPHSYFDTDQPRAKHVRLRWQVDFHAHQLTGTATLVFETPSAGTVDLDSKGLTSLRYRRRQATTFPMHSAMTSPSWARSFSCSSRPRAAK
jgi:hypothetical protein